MTLLAVALAFTASSTSYSPCSAGQTMSDGTRVRFGSVASNRHPLGTRITLSRPFMGWRKFTVRDRIGHGSSLDLWSPSCAYAVAYGRQTRTYRIGWPRVRRVGVVSRQLAREGLR